MRRIPKRVFVTSKQRFDGHCGIVPSRTAPHVVYEWDATRPGDSQAVGAQKSHEARVSGLKSRAKRRLLFVIATGFVLIVAPGPGGFDF